MNRGAHRGVVLMGLMVLLALGGLAAVKYGESAAVARQREQETQLLWIGQQYRQALESYYLASPGPVKHLPVQLAELVRDSRFPAPVRHLRKLYADPIQPDVPWGLVRRGNQIIGVYSQADGEPLRRQQLGAGMEGMEGATQYAGWRFLFVPRAVPATASPAPSPGSTSIRTTNDLPRTAP
jgi:type II secretory pathway pseudopilin PulG